MTNINIIENISLHSKNNNFASKDKTSFKNNKQTFSNILNNEKKNFTLNNQNATKNIANNNIYITNNTLNQPNKLNEPSRELEVSNYENSGQSLKQTETKQLRKQENIKADEIIENIEEELKDKNENTLYMLISMLSTMLEDILNFNMEDVSKDNIEIDLEQLQSLNDLMQQLTDSIDMTNILVVDESFKKNIEITIEFINKLNNGQLITNEEQLNISGFNKVVNNLEELKDSMQLMLNESNFNVLVNPQKLHIIDNSKHIDEIQKENVIENIEDIEMFTDTIYNKEEDIKSSIKVVNKIVLEDKEEGFGKQTENEAEIFFKENTILSQQNLKDEVINLKVVKDQIIEPRQFIREIAQKASAFLLKDKNEMNIQLMPENLGKLSIKIGLNEGALTGKIYAENYSVKETIEANLNQLKDSLEEQGLNIAGLEVYISDNAQNFERNLYQSKFTNRQKSKVSLVETIDDMVTLEQNIDNTNPYLETSQFDSLV